MVTLSVVEFCVPFCLLSDMTSSPVVAVDCDTVPLALPTHVSGSPGLGTLDGLSTRSHYAHKTPSPYIKSTQLTCQPSIELLMSGPYLQSALHGEATLPDMSAATSSV